MIGRRFFASFLGVMVTASLSASASQWEWNYKTAQRELSVNGDAAVNEFLSLSVAPAQETLEEALINQGKALLKTIESNNGSISASMTLPSSWECGRYNLNFEGKTHYLMLTNNTFCQTVSSVTTKESIKALMTDANGFSGGADETQKIKIAQIMANYIPNGGYDADSFVRQYMILEGMILFRENAISIDNYLERYALYLQSEVPDEQKTAFADVLKFYEGSPEDIIAEGMLLLSLRSGNKTNFTEKTLAYINSKSLDKGSFTSLNSFHVNELWDTLYAGRGSLTSFQGLYNSFLTEASAKYILQQGAEGSFEGTGSGNDGSISSGGGGGGGGSSTKPSENVTQNNNYFSDLEGHWAKQEIQKLAERGIVSGVGNGIFEPDRTVTRAEFTKMLVTMLSLPQEKTDAFADVKSNDWYSGVVGAAYRAGIVMGSDRLFYPNNSISREDAAVMLYRFLKYSGTQLSGNTSFDDQNSISDYASEAVGALANNGIITGYENRFRPKDTTSRAEAAVMIGRADN